MNKDQLISLLDKLPADAFDLWIGGDGNRITFSTREGPLPDPIWIWVPEGQHIRNARRPGSRRFAVQVVT